MGKYNSYLDVEPQIENTKDGTKKKINFWGIKDRQDAENILDAITEPGDSTFARKGLPGKNILRAWYTPSRTNMGLFVVVANEAVEDFINTGLRSIIFSLLKSNNYDKEKIANLEHEVAHKLETSDSWADKRKALADADVHVADLWQRYLNNINDPVTREALKLYSQIYTTTSYGHALSLANVMRIRAINPDATFVLSETVWNSWGYGIKRGAKKYPLWAVRFTQGISKKDLENAKAKLGHELEQLGDLGVAVQEAIRIEAEKEANKGLKPMFILYYGYDIADTYQYNSKEVSPLMSKPNISSNVVYKLNALAQKLEDEKEKGLGEKEKEIRDTTDMKYNVASETMINLCEKNGIKTEDIVNNSTSNQKKLINLLDAYYNYIINASSNKKSPNKINVLKPENIQNYIQDAIQLTLLMNSIPFNKNDFTHSEIYNQNEAATLGPIIRTAAEAIGKALNPKQKDNVNEGIFEEGAFGLSFDEALKKLGIKVVSDNTPEMQMEAIKENFNKMLNRINNPIIY